MKKIDFHRVVLLFTIVAFLFGSCRSEPGKPVVKEKSEQSYKSFSNSDNQEGFNYDLSSGGTPDFINAASKATPAVVHIKTRFLDQRTNSPFGRLYGQGSVVIGSGSGVVLTKDGYIATNNHVVENAAEIQVIFPDRRYFKASLIGADPNTDLALLKVEVEDAPTIRIGNSDRVQVGEWVLAVGYPLSLNTTVTAGIISAKGRSIGIIGRSQDSRTRGSSQTASTAVESFLQTDAAINSGNSGGALVNIQGELIGINTAIASQTGSYAGYAFAIPVNLAVKILDDLRNYGDVRRAILGVSFPPPSVEDQYLKQQGIEPGSVIGVYIIDVQKGSAASQAGLKSGDFIQSINDVSIESSAELSEQIARHHPGDKVSLTYLRNGKTHRTDAVLKGDEAMTGQSASELFERLGATFAPLSSNLKDELNINSGVLITEVHPGGFFDRAGVPAGTIIVVVNGRAVNNRNDVEQALLSARRGIIRMLAVAPDGSRVAFNFSLGT